MVQLLLYREAGLQPPQHSPHHALLSIPPNITCIRAHPGTGDSVAPSPPPVDMQQKEFGLCQVFWFGHPFPWDGHLFLIIFPSVSVTNSRFPLHEQEDFLH